MALRRVDASAWLASVVLLAGLGAQGAERAAEVVSVQGQGESRADEAAPWQPAAARQALYARNFVRTGAYSRMGLVFEDRTQVRLAEKTMMQIKAAAARPADRTVLRLERGRSWAQTNATPANLYLETPSATAAVRGTDWEIEVQDGGRSLLTVLSGEVVFFNPQGSVTVARNEQAEAVPGRAPVKLVIVNPRSRVQWVTAHTIDARRHIDAAATPPEELARLQRIAEHVRAERLEAAYAAALEEIATPRTTQPSAWLIASDLMVHQGRIERANDFAQQGLARFRGDPRLVAQLARISLAAGEIEEAGLRLAPVMAASLPAFEAQLVAADVARADGQALRARRGYTAALAQRPADDRPWHGIGVVDSEREAIASGRAHLRAALERNPSGAGYQGELGTLETFAGRFDEAARAFEAALAANPSDYVALTGLGVLQLKRGEPQAALASFLRASTLEPRYARARMHAAVAHYRLGRAELALRELSHAAELDDKDPLPHLFASMILTDLYRIAEAIEEARTAMRLLPYLKSLNQVATDLQGNANLGRSLSFFGLEEWAQNRAQESYFPYWAGSHLFLSDRYAGEFNRNSALMQGFLADPTVFGASNRLQSLVQGPGHYGRGLFGYAWADDINARSLIGRFNGLTHAGMPVAYLVDADRTRFNFTGDTRGPSDTRHLTAAVGLRPVHELGLFLYGFDTSDEGDTRSPSAEFSQRLETSSVNVGAHYRLSPTSNLWTRWGRLRNTNENVGALLGDPFESYLASRQPEYGARHTFDAGNHQITWGAEAAHKRMENLFIRFPLPEFPDVSLHTTLGFDERSRNAYVSDTADFGPLRVQADAWWQENRRRLAVESLGFIGAEPVPFDPAFEDRSLKKVTARVGLRYRLSDRALVRAAWQDWVRPMGTSTLGPVATAGIPVDDRLVTRGGRQKRGRVQIEVEGSPRTFWTAFADHKEIDNLRFGFEPFLISEDENLSKLRHFDYGRLAAGDLYEFISAPSFDAARITIAGAALNLIATDTLSLRARYEHTDSRNTGERFAGRAIPLHPRHALALGATYMGPQHVFVTGRAVYRTRRYADEENLSPRRPGWDFASDVFWETRDKRFRVRFSLDNAFHKERETIYTAVLVYNF